MRLPCLCGSMACMFGVSGFDKKFLSPWAYCFFIRSGADWEKAKTQAEVSG